MLQRATVKAGLGIKVHPHNLRHACGYKLANDGVDTRSLQAWLGHKNIEHTVVGHAATISAGEFIQASGEWSNDRTWPAIPGAVVGFSLPTSSCDSDALIGTLTGAASGIPV